MRFFGHKNDDNQEQSLSHRLKSYRIFRNLLIGFIVIAIFNLLFSSFFYTPKIIELSEQKRKIEIKNRILLNKIRAAQNAVNQIRHRDNFVYRPLFSSDTFSIDGIYQQYPESKYAWTKNRENKEELRSIWLEMDYLARTLYLSSKSLDELQTLSKDKEEFSRSIPAIWPIDRTKLRNKIGAFGYRMHPTLRYWKMHEGVDLGGKIGDPIFATGNGVVDEVVINRSKRSYGTYIVINHGFGYKTRYAHLDKVHVQRGDSVTRNQLIGDLGNTGRSSGPHLHYEVMYRGMVVNPINYFEENMSAEAYKSLMGWVQDENYEMITENEEE